MQIESVRRLSGAMGAEITGIDLAADIDRRTFDAVRDHFLEHIVLVFRNQNLPPERQVAFTARFGEVEAHPERSSPKVDGFPQVGILENRPDRPGGGAAVWHSDISCAERPPALSVFSAQVVPEGRGDTMFCNMVRAYEDLSKGMQAMLGGLRARHSWESIISGARARRERDSTLAAQPFPEFPARASHPVVRTHPDTGRKALFINPSFTVCFEDMTDEESTPLLTWLYDRATRPENIYRHPWREGDVIMWDNRASMHYGVYDYDPFMPRRMYRTTAAGDRPS